MLNAKQTRFVQEYVVDLNATDAARRAGYNERSVEAIGYENLRKPQIQAAIAEIQSRRAERTEVKADRVVAELARVGFSDVRRLFNDDGSMKSVKDWPDDVAAAVSSIETLEEYEGSGENRRFVGLTKKVKLWDKNKALASLMQHLGMVVHKLKVEEERTLVVRHEYEQLRRQPADEIIRLYRQAFSSPPAPELLAAASPGDGPLPS